METFVYQGTSKRLSKVLSERLPSYSFSYLCKLIRTGDVKINSVRVKTDVALSGGESIIVYCKEKVTPLDKVFENDLIAVYNKYSGISSEAFADNVISQHPEWKLCHRLDTNTIGLLLFAKNNLIFDSIKEMFSKHLIEKHYFAEVFGHFEHDRVFSDYLIKKSQENRVVIVPKEARGAVRIVTECRPISFSEEITRLDVSPVTGKTHQIRAHLAFHGYPIVGDGKYGDNDKNKKHKTHVQHLCAYKLIFHCASIPAISSLDSLTVEIPFPTF